MLNIIKFLKIKNFSKIFNKPNNSFIDNINYVNRSI